jgi:hypothetical protein
MVSSISYVTAVLILVGWEPGHGVRGTTAGELQRIGTLAHPAITEASGLAPSRRHAGVFWTINDSGNAPLLFAVDRAGKLLAEYRLKGALNLDWEALTSDGAGNLYIGDVGNNAVPGGLPRRWVYRIKEPDPYQRGADTRQIALDRVHPYTFPAKPFDVEGMFIHKGKLYLVSKTLKAQTQLYHLPLDQPGQAVQLVEICNLPGVTHVTDAALSPDGRWLAVCSDTYAARFELKADEPLESLERKTPTVVRFTARSIEGCCWDGEDLILVSEDREVFMLRF